MKGGYLRRCISGRRHAEKPVSPGRQMGATLIVALLMLIVIVLLGTSAAQLALLEEKASRSDRDHQVALQAAEAALLDAELDIQGSPDTAHSRSHIFSSMSVQGFPAAEEMYCNAGQANIYLGLCRSATPGERPSWQLVNFMNTDPVSMHSVPYGKFTGQSFSIAKGALPGRLPRYVIELLVYAMPGEDASKTTHVYRVTAIGFGARDTTQVVLQSIYRKGDA